VLLARDLMFTCIVRFQNCLMYIWCDSRRRPVMEPRCMHIRLLPRHFLFLYDISHEYRLPVVCDAMPWKRMSDRTINIYKPAYALFVFICRFNYFASCHLQINTAMLSVNMCDAIFVLIVRSATQYNTIHTVDYQLTTKWYFQHMYVMKATYFTIKY